MRAAAPVAPAWSAQSPAVAALALALRYRRIAGPRLDADRQLHFGNRSLQIARNIHGERLERRDIKSVQTALAAHVSGPVEISRGTFPPASWRVLVAARIPPKSAESRPVSCRRRLARSEEPNGRLAPRRASRADARAASSRVRQTSGRKVQEEGWSLENGHARGPDGAGSTNFRATTTRDSRPAAPFRCAPMFP